MKRVGIWLALLGLSFFQGCCNPPPRTVVVAAPPGPTLMPQQPATFGSPAPFPTTPVPAGFGQPAPAPTAPPGSASGCAAAAAAIDHGAAGAIVVEPDRGGLAGGRGERTGTGQPEHSALCAGGDRQGAGEIDQGAAAGEKAERAGIVPVDSAIRRRQGQRLHRPASGPGRPRLAGANQGPHRRQRPRRRHR